MSKYVMSDKCPDELQVSGYASLFSVQDVSGDIVRKGAFAASLLKHGGAPLPMLFGHETAMPIGVWERVTEDGKGLFVQGRLLKAPKSRRHISRLVARGALAGLSIGYRALRSTPRAAGGRDLLELDLWEVSIVAFPMLRDARLSLSQSTDFSFPQLSKRTA